MLADVATLRVRCPLCDEAGALAGVASHLFAAHGFCCMCKSDDGLDPQNPYVRGEAARVGKSVLDGRTVVRDWIKKYGSEIEYLQGHTSVDPLLLTQRGLDTFWLRSVSSPDIAVDQSYIQPHAPKRKPDGHDISLMIPMNRPVVRTALGYSFRGRQTPLIHLCRSHGRVLRSLAMASKAARKYNLHANKFLADGDDLGFEICPGCGNAVRDVMKHMISCENTILEHMMEFLLRNNKNESIRTILDSKRGFSFPHTLEDVKNGNGNSNAISDHNPGVDCSLDGNEIIVSEHMEKCEYQPEGIHIPMYTLEESLMKSGMIAKEVLEQDRFLDRRLELFENLKKLFYKDRELGVLFPSDKKIKSSYPNVAGMKRTLLFVEDFYLIGSCATRTSTSKSDTDLSILVYKKNQIRKDETSENWTDIALTEEEISAPLSKEELERAGRLIKNVITDAVVSGSMESDISLDYFPIVARSQVLNVEFNTDELGPDGGFRSAISLCATREESNLSLKRVEYVKALENTLPSGLYQMIIGVLKRWCFYGGVSIGSAGIGLTKFAMTTEATNILRETSVVKIMLRAGVVTKDIADSYTEDIREMKALPPVGANLEEYSTLLRECIPGFFVLTEDQINACAMYIVSLMSLQMSRMFSSLAKYNAGNEKEQAWKALLNIVDDLSPTTPSVIDLHLKMSALDALVISKQWSMLAFSIQTLGILHPDFIGGELSKHG